MASKITFHPKANPVLVGLQEGRTDIRGWRPQGRNDWLLILTLGGNAYFRAGGREFKAGPGDLTIIQPGTPQDYGMDEETGYWKNIWVHVQPRPAWLEWLRRPVRLTGHIRIRLTPHLQEGVEEDLRTAEAVLHGRRKLSEEMAMNAIERAILRIASARLQRGRVETDARIEKAETWLNFNHAAPVRIDTLARQSGLGRSRFYDLFLRQTGLTPSAYVEQQRLERGRQLLAYTSMTVSEIAGQLGYASPFYFSLRFKAYTGKSPVHFRKHNQKG